MNVGILTAGGDCPGLNAAIRGFGKAAILGHGMKLVGFRAGFSGLIEDDWVALEEGALSGILSTGGTVLGTSREKPFKDIADFARDKPGAILKTYKRRKLDCLVCIGGNGTMKTALKLSQAGLNVIGIPKTIDNDVYGTDVSFGFDSALGIITDSLDRIHTTASSHRRVMVVEVMGHSAGWLALHSGVAGGADVILIPEIPYSLEAVCESLRRRLKSGKQYSIVVAAEGIDFQKESASPGPDLAKRIAKATGLETRETVLGYIQRGGSPSPADRVIATKLGSVAARSANEGAFGVMMAVRDGEVCIVPLQETAGKTKTVPPGSRLVAEARAIGTSFGDGR